MSCLLLNISNVLIAVIIQLSSNAAVIVGSLMIKNKQI